MDQPWLLPALADAPRIREGRRGGPQFILRNSVMDFCGAILLISKYYIFDIISLHIKRDDGMILFLIRRSAQTLDFL